MILLVRQRFKIFPSEEYMAHFSHRRIGGNSQLRSKVGRNPERQRRLVWFLTRSITWARVIYIFYRSPECSIRTALFFFRGATRISLWYSNWSACEEWSVLLRLELVRWLQRHTHVIAFQFLGEEQDPCEWHRDFTSHRYRWFMTQERLFWFRRARKAYAWHCVFAKHFSLLEPADGICRRCTYMTLYVTHRFIWFHLMCKLSAQGV